MALPPTSLVPMLASLGSIPADIGAFGYELKWDGFRAVCRWDGRRCSLWSRNLNDLTADFPEIAAMGAHLPGPLLLDGEIVALDAQRRPSFSLLQTRLEPHLRHRDANIRFMIFDVLWHRGHSTMVLPYAQRRQLLERLALAGPAWETPPWHPDGRTLLAFAREHALEGIVAKRLDGRYLPGRRSGDWLKVKLQRHEDLVIGGYLLQPDGVSLGSLLLGYHAHRPGRDAASKKLVYCGKTGTGFTHAMGQALLRTLTGIRRPTSPFAAPSVAGVRPKGTWVEPRLVVEVAFSEWTHVGQLRHASFRGVRPDKAPEDVTADHLSQLAVEHAQGAPMLTQASVPSDSTPSTDDP